MKTTETKKVLKWEETNSSNLIRKFETFKDVKKYSSGKGRNYYNLVCAFDIETTSFYYDGHKSVPSINGLSKKRQEDFHKCGTMCAWTFGIEGISCIGRTWREFLKVCDALIKTLGITKENRLIIWVHNLSYEFQWIRFLFKWKNVFSLSERQPIYALTDSGLEFRCSYLLSGYSLDSLSKQLTLHEIRKMVGEWDYSLFRHSKTKLSKAERGYLLNDGRVVMAYIQEYMNRAGGKITSLPLTKTGAVRRVCRDNCLFINGNHHEGGSKYRKYREMMETLTIKDANEYKQAVRAFQGGFTHANPFRVGDVIRDVTSMDFTSSYPAVLLSEMFPMSRARLVHPKTQKEVDDYLLRYLSIFDVTFTDLEPKILSDNPISLSKCWGADGEEVANGRVVRAKRISTTLTSIDFSYMKFFYSWKKIKFTNMRIFYKGYLPRDLLLSILEFYGRKTTLKGVEGMEVEYQQGKEYLNSIYGMMVTAITRDEIKYEDDSWQSELPDIEEALDKYNKSKNRFTYYYWGVFCTAYARRNLFTGIYECCGKGAKGADGSLDLTLDDYCYADTDSVKIRNFDRHKKYFETYNREIQRKIERMCEARNIDVALTKPKTQNGEEKPIGVWDYDGHAVRFRTLGAKRYFYEDDSGEYHLTISGVNKKKAVPYLVELAKKEGKDVFDYINDDMTIPRGSSGRNIHTYIDEPLEGILVDHNGMAYPFKEYSAIHLEESAYSLSMSEQFLNYLAGIRNLKV